MFWDTGRPHSQRMTPFKVVKTFFDSSKDDINGPIKFDGDRGEVIIMYYDLLVFLTG